MSGTPYWLFDYVGIPRKLKSCRLKTNPYWRPTDTGSNNGNFEIHLDIKPFQADEISIKVDNDLIIVNAEHNEKEDEYGTISRNYTRSFFLPENSDKNGIQSKLSSDGVLTIIVPVLQSPSRRIPILFTGAPLNQQSPSANAA